MWAFGFVSATIRTPRPYHRPDEAIGTMLLVEVDFGHEKQFKKYAVLEPVESRHDVIDLLSTGNFGTPADLRRVLTFEKVKGELTNIFYSMESSNTAFYPHQFKPVMNFIESRVGRLLIADEVGLGKTIEATYIWKEIQARHGARRLLIVCPAMLREKWRSDLRKRFNISGEIVTAHQLYERLNDIATHRTEDSFVYIVSLESVRAPTNYDDTKKTSVKAKLARLLDQNAASESFALLDNVIIDEAHYLRNVSTGNNRVAQLLRDASRHLVLLTATPIQLGSANLYQLLRLIDPDEFYSEQLFSEMMEANTHIVRAQRALWRQPPQFEEARDAIKAARAVDYFRQDPILARVLPALEAGTLDNEQRIDTLRSLEISSLLSRYMTRSRKREVMEHRVERSPQTLQLNFSAPELGLYNHVTQRIRQKAEGKTGAALFSLISRQRQMASSIVGALESWDEKGVTDELLWEDLGMSAGAELDLEDADGAGEHLEESKGFGANFDIKELERVDSKYAQLQSRLLEELAKNPAEKFVVFAYFRGTLKYLHRRLKADGLKSILLMGDMGADKDSIIAEFAKPDGPSILLSSEVGSEGIDLQFCRFLVNYDLPWNPMRVEQRIGRLDRLGQPAERISIINLSVQNTIEDRILERLYNRINVFRESIGDLEDILGDITQTLMPDLLNPHLSDSEREKRAADTELAIVNKRKEQDRLETEAVNLVGFSDYILSNIKNSRDQGRWLSAEELIAFVEDYLPHVYTGSTIKTTDTDTTLSILLSDEARRDLADFIARERPSTRTRLHQSGRPIVCVFDPRGHKASGEIELMDPSHPLIRWVRERYQADQSKLYPLSALTLSAQDAGVSPGDYAYCTQLWAFDGIKSEKLLSFAAKKIGSDDFLDPDKSEALVYKAARHGEVIANASNNLGDMHEVHAGIAHCGSSLDEAYFRRYDSFEAENAARCAQQRTSAHKYADRRIEDYQRRVANFQSRGQAQLVPMTEGLILREREQLAEKLAKIDRHKNVDPTMANLAAGIIRVR
jgi:SNF2 family DNA or RNA helicase